MAGSLVAAVAVVYRSSQCIEVHWAAAMAEQRAHHCASSGHSVGHDRFNELALHTATSKAHRVHQVASDSRRLAKSRMGQRFYGTSTVLPIGQSQSAAIVAKGSVCGEQSAQASARFV